MTKNIDALLKLKDPQKLRYKYIWIYAWIQFQPSI